MTHLYISAAHKSSGKTTLSIGLCAAMRSRGRFVQPFKKGPDYIDPMWLGLAAGRECHNLDFYTQTEDEVLSTVSTYSEGADISIIEGNKGLYDGLDVEGSNSNAALAKLLGSPVVLVLDVRGTIRGVAPLLIGYQTFDPQINIAGVILNQVGGNRHERKLREVIEYYTDVEVVGAVARNPQLELVERHLGLMPSNEDSSALEKIQGIANIISSEVDMERLMEIAQASRLPTASTSEINSSNPSPDVRIGIAKDAAFGFYYPGDLDALRRAGAELMFFNTLKDLTLPKVDGLFIGGGFPETQMQALEANRPLRQAIHEAIENGMPAYAECGGLMYLARSLSWKGDTHEMVGVIAGDIVMHERPMGRGYIRLKETEDMPWPAQQDAAEIAAHEFHYSSLENIKVDYTYAYRMLRGRGINGKHDGLVYKNLLACYGHQRDTRQNHWAQRFVDFVRYHQ